MIELFKSLQKYNYWDENSIINTGFPRSFYLNKINAVIDNKLVKVLIGQRRTGKSFVLRQIIQNLIDTGVNRKNIFYLNKEQFEFDAIQHARHLNELFEFYKKTLRVSGKIYIFLDEIQDISEWEKITASWSQDTQDQYELFITGSNSTMLSSELGTLLGGRYLPYYIFPFSYPEYIELHGLEQGKSSFIQYLQTGGLPELFNLQEQEAKVHYLSALKDSIILNDIVKKYKVRDIQLLERLFIYIVNNPATLFSFRKIVDSLTSAGMQTNYETVANYVLYLRNAMLIHECERYDIKGKSILSGERKFYLNDLSFRNYLSSAFDTGLSHQLENIAYLHYRRLGGRVFAGTIYNNEVDFVVEQNDAREYIQICYLLADKDIIEREYRSLRKIKDSYKKSVVSLDEIRLKNNEGIEHFPAWELFGTKPGKSS